MRNFLISIYDFVTAPIYRRLLRDVTVQLQDISAAYIDQHERLTAKMVQEYVRLLLRIERLEDQYEGRQRVDELAAEQGTFLGMQPEEIRELLESARSSFDLVEICTKKNVPLHKFFELQANCHGMDRLAIRKMNALEQSNVELQRMTAMLLAELASNRKEPGTESGALPPPPALAEMNSNGKH